MPPGYRNLVTVAAFGVVLLGVACGQSGPTAPTDTTTTPTVAAPTATERFNGVLPVGGVRFYSFSVSVYGTVNITLLSVSEARIPSTAMLGLAIGSPSGTGCTVGSAVTVAADSTPQLTGAYIPGVYCARIYDVGNLSTPATFDISIDHP